jgi:hypothetical protein
MLLGFQETTLVKYSQDTILMWELSAKAHIPVHAWKAYKAGICRALFILNLCTRWRWSTLLQLLELQYSRAQSLSGHSEEQKLFPSPWNKTTQLITMSVYWVHYLGSLKCIPEIKTTPVQNAEQCKSSLPICQWTSKFHLLLTEITQPIHSIKITTIPHHIQVLLSVTYCTLPNGYTLLSVTYCTLPNWYTLLKAKGHYMWIYSEHKV